MNNKNSNQDQLWKRCPEGMLRQVADRSTEQNRIQKGTGGENQFDRRRLLKLAAAIAVSAGAGTLAYRSLIPPVNPERPMATRRSRDESGYGGINCATCVSNVEKYIQKTLEDQKLVAKIHEHLRLCDFCREKYEKMLEA